MYKCSDISKLNNSPIEECENVISKIYKFNKIISLSGTTGIVLEIEDSDKNKYALKISNYREDTIREIKIGCELSYLIQLQYTDLFVTPIYWSNCIGSIYDISKASNADDFEDQIDNVSVSTNSALIIMPLASYDFTHMVNEKSLTVNEFISIMFELLYSLIISRKILGFSHNDLRADNILIKEVDENISRTYKINNYQFYISSKYIPYITDYNTSTLSNEKINSTDFFAIISLFKTYLKYHKPNTLMSTNLSDLVSKDNYFINDNNFETNKVIQFILNQKIFNHKTIYDELKQKNLHQTYIEFNTPFMVKL